jgi:hypothetical protein
MSFTRWRLIAPVVVAVDATEGVQGENQKLWETSLGLWSLR